MTGPHTAKTMRRWPAYGAALLIGILAIGAARTPEEADAATLVTAAGVDDGGADGKRGAGAGAFAAGDPASGDRAQPLDQVGRLLERARLAARALDRAQAMYDAEIAPIEAVLRRYRDDPALTRAIAMALVREAHRANLEPRVLLSVLLVENPMLDPQARSFVGATGLMQVMPLHQGHWRACEPDLESIDDNICHGAQIFASYLRQTGGDIDRALLRYNGCVNGTNTPNCHGYPSWVYARAGRVSMMTWLANAREAHASSSSAVGAAAP